MWTKLAIIKNMFLIVQLISGCLSNKTQINVADSKCISENINNLISIISQSSFIENKPNFSISGNQILSLWIFHLIRTVAVSFPVKILLCEELDKIPKIASNELTVLIIRNGNIKDISARSFTNLTKLQFIDLSHNQIVSIQNNTFEKLISLKELDLRFNRINEISMDIFGLSQSFVAPPVIRLRGNPIKCTCDLWIMWNAYTIIPSDDYFSCKLHYKNQNQTEKRVSLSNKIDFTNLEDTRKRFIKICESVGIIIDEESISEIKSHESIDSCKKQKVDSDGIDISLLVIMAAWFFMIYFGINKFIKDNMLDKDLCMEYNLFDKVGT